MSQILGIWRPIAFRDFDGDQTGQRLLLARATQSGEFAADGHNGRGNGILGMPRARAQIRLHGLDVIVMTTAVGWMVAFRIISGGLRDAVVAGMLGPGNGSQTLDTTGGIATFPAGEGIPAFTGVIGMTSRIAWQTATGGWLIPGGGSG